MKLIFLYMRDIDILCVSETWLLNETPKAQVYIPDFKIFRCDDGRGGGVCIYVNNLLKTNVINLSFSKKPGIEDVWVSVQSGMLPAIIVGCIYRHPKSTVTSFEDIQEVLRQSCLSKKRFYVLGEFNDNLLAQGKKMSGILKSNKLTRVTASSATLLDLIITNAPDSVVKKDIVPLCGVEPLWSRTVVFG